MAICPLVTMLRDASVDNRALGAFNVASMEMLLGVVAAAETANLPVVVQIAEKDLKQTPLHLFGPMMAAAARSSRVDMAVLLDRARSRNLLELAVACGFNAVSFDGSGLPLTENIAGAREIADWAHGWGVSMEASVAGPDGGGARPEEAVRMAAESGCDALILAVREQAGQLDFKALEEIYFQTETPLVLDGVGGRSIAEMHRSVAFGVRKINIGLAIQEALIRGAGQFLSTSPVIDYPGFNEAMTAQVEEAALTHMTILADPGL